MTRVRISEEALGDLDDGFWFYEAQGAGLGDYFRTSLTAEIDGLKFTAGIHPIVYKDYHRLLCRLFPYGIFYTVESKVTTVWAVIDLRSDPGWIRRHLED